MGRAAARARTILHGIRVPTSVAPAGATAGVAPEEQTRQSRVFSLVGGRRAGAAIERRESK